MAQAVKITDEAFAEKFWDTERKPTLENFVIAVLCATFYAKKAFPASFPGQEKDCQLQAGMMITAPLVPGIDLEPEDVWRMYELCKLQQRVLSGRKKGRNALPAVPVIYCSHPEQAINRSELEKQTQTRIATYAELKSLGVDVEGLAKSVQTNHIEEGLLKGIKAVREELMQQYKVDLDELRESYQNSQNDTNATMEELRQENMILKQELEVLQEKESHSNSETLQSVLDPNRRS